MRLKTEAFIGIPEILIEKIIKNSFYQSLNYKPTSRKVKIISRKFL